MTETGSFCRRWLVKLGLLLVVVAGLLPTGAGAGDEAQGALTPLVITAGGSDTHRFRVELADTDGERMRGLMFRRHLPPDRGMLFVWSRSAPLRMWMKNTLISLDMLFLDDQGRIVHLEHRTTPHDLTPRGPDQPVRAVLELPGGTADRLGLSEGDQVRHAALSGTKAR